MGILYVTVEGGVDVVVRTPAATNVANVTPSATTLASDAAPLRAALALAAALALLAAPL